jgi:hypothetical protein
MIGASTASSASWTFSVIWSVLWHALVQACVRGPEDEKDTWTFSIMTLMPASKHFSMMPSSFLLSSLVIWRLLALSFSLNE